MDRIKKPYAKFKSSIIPQTLYSFSSNDWKKRIIAQKLQVPITRRKKNVKDTILANFFYYILI